MVNWHLPLFYSLVDFDLCLSNEEHWVYLNFVKVPHHASSLAATTAGPARPKIYHLRKLLLDNVAALADSWPDLVEKLSTEDEVSIKDG